MKWVIASSTVGRGSRVEVGDSVDAGTGVAVGVGVLGRGIAVEVGARATDGTAVEVGGWLTVSEPLQATAKKSVATISVRRTREVVTSNCPLSAGWYDSFPQVALHAA